VTLLSSRVVLGPPPAGTPVKTQCHWTRGGADKEGTTSLSLAVVTWVTPKMSAFKLPKPDVKDDKAAVSEALFVQ
jgi:hypothetical protein